METAKIQKSTTCRQCKKEIKTEEWKCIPCVKLFHPSCIKIHKVYNQSNELLPCKGKIEVIVIKASNVTVDEAEGDNRKEHGIVREEGHGKAEDKIDILSKVINEIKNEIAGKDIIRDIIRETIKEEMDNIRRKIIERLYGERQNLEKLWKMW